MGWKHDMVGVETMDGKTLLCPTQSYYECDKCYGTGTVMTEWIHDSAHSVKCSDCGGGGKLFQHQCKFCGHRWLKNSPCETGSNWGEDGEYQPSYCGNQCCPMCDQCQGNEVTESRVEMAQGIAAIKLGLY